MSDSQATANANATKWVGVPITVIRNGGKPIPLSSLKAGDICCLFKDGTAYHVIYYMGDGKYADCTSGRKQNIKAGMALSATTKSHLKVAIRYTGK